MKYMINDTSNRRIFFSLAVIGILTILIYGRMLDNFFYYDDFEWIDKVKDLGRKPLSIFNPVVHPPTSYVTPMGYIVFWLNYKLFGLSPFGYHLFSLILHILNSYLVVYLVWLLSSNLGLAALTGLFFATNFAITDAVVWPSAYVDTVMFFFYTASLIAFLVFSTSRSIRYYILSLFLFILSLSAKGTALTLPLALFILEQYYAPQKIDATRLLKYIPFVIIVLLYIGLIKYVSVSENSIFGSVDVAQVILNAVKIPMTLFIPEGLLPRNIWLASAFTLLIPFFAVAIIKKKGACSIAPLGIFLMITGILPLLIIKWNFPTDPDPFNESIGQRLYLGNLGESMFLGEVFYGLYITAHKAGTRAILGLLLISFIGVNIYWNAIIQSRWAKATSDTRSALNELQQLADRYPPGSKIYFINFPPKQGFGISFFKLYFERFKFEFGVWPSYIPPANLREVNIFLHLNGHIYSNPDAAASLASTPWDHFYVAQFYLLAGEHKKGLAELERAAAFNSDEKLHYLTALTYNRLGATNKAINELKKVIAINENSVKAYELLGSLSFDTGDYRAAIKWYEKVISLNSKDSETMGKLAELYDLNGEVTKAKEMWERALKYEEREDFKKLIKEKLEEIRQ